MFLPIQHDNRTLGRIEEKYKFMWEQLHSRMDQRQREWRSEMDELRRSFFKGTCLSPTDPAPSTPLGFHSTSPHEPPTSPVCSSPVLFHHEFDVKFFKPEEISVRTLGGKLVVQASHRESNFNKSVSREFKREIDIPPSLDPQSLQCCLNSDGKLVISIQMPEHLDSTKDQTFQEPHSLDKPCTQGIFSPFGASGYTDFSTSRDESSSISSSSDSCAHYSKHAPEWTTPPLPDVIDNHFICSESDTTSPPKYTTICRSQDSTENNIRSIHTQKRPLHVDVDLGKNIDPSQLKIDAVDRILLVRVFAFDRRGHTRVWKIHLPQDLDPSDVGAHLTDDSHLILEEHTPSWNYHST